MPFDLKAELMTQWEGNRRLTLRTAAAFPAGQLLTFTPAQPLRPFGAMCDEIARMQLAYMRGLAEDRWVYDADDPARPKDAAGVAALLENVQDYTRRAWPEISEQTLLTVREDPFFFGATKRPYDWLVYCLENEIHHRGQGYIYLRHLGIEPPAFWERG